MLSGLQETPRGQRLHIGVFGRTNAGKSTVVNQICGGDISLISPVKGTTTDPVYKAMELLPIGPVEFIDTPGLDDTSEIGEKRIEKTMEVLQKTDLAVLVISSENDDLAPEREYLQMFQKYRTPAVAIVNEIGGKKPGADFFGQITAPHLSIDASQPQSREEMKRFLIENIPQEVEKSLTDGLVQPGDTVVLVMPQDIQAPKGRLILPQVQMLRDLLDHRCNVICTLPSLLKERLEGLKEPPQLIITDSQCFREVNEMVDENIPLTSFSILLSKNKGDIEAFVEGAKAIAGLRENDRVLILEACTHHALKGDIAREKLPRLLEKYVGGPLSFEVFSGSGLPKNMDGVKLAVHCGGCMINRKNMLSRMAMAQEYGVKITNFGTALAFLNGMLERVCY